jgi:hypothetical protein
LKMSPTTKPSNTIHAIDLLELCLPRLHLIHELHATHKSFF